MIDGAKAMTRCYSGLIARLMIMPNAIWLYRFLHRSQATKSSSSRSSLKIIISNTTSGYEIAGNFRSQIRVFVSGTILTSERSERVKIVLRNKYKKKLPSSP
jgi:hypothetical protein